MSRSFKKLVTLLKELFQLDRPDLDFGFYRIMHAKSAEVTQFLEQDLLPQVQAALSQYQSADKAAIEKELDETVRRIKSDGADLETSFHYAPTRTPRHFHAFLEEFRGTLLTDAFLPPFLLQQFHFREL